MSHQSASVREPLILGEKTYHQITEDIAKPIEGKANNGRNTKKYSAKKQS